MFDAQLDGALDHVEQGSLAALVPLGPRALAQRPLPSITNATCCGTASAGISGGPTPLGCGCGARGAAVAGAAFAATLGERIKRGRSAGRRRWLERL